MLRTGDDIALTIEKPAAGGRMLARHEGQVVFVQGAIPGERVRARVERVERQLAFASTTELLEPSPDRRDPGPDPLCGGCTYAHVAYARQLVLKSELIQDAFTRLGRVPLAEPVTVAPSPDRGYRMRARFRVQGTRVGFYREGTHDLCDAAATGQLLDASVSAVHAAMDAALAMAPIVSAELSENVAADERVLHMEAASGAEIPLRALETAMEAGGLTGCSASAAGYVTSAGSPLVTDPLSVLTGGRAGSGRLQRHAQSFFQANRYLLPELVGTVLDAVSPQGEVIELYAGVGLFAISLAQSGRERITAVEGDRTSARDLTANALACGAAVRVVAGSVEEFLSRAPHRPGTLIVDPPRTGISKAAMNAAVRTQASRVVYVSCDPATMARDARRLLDAGYALTSLRAFDLFPNTPHVETVGTFDAASGAGARGGGKRVE
jgi:23S rRNA (uracil1939-C5)-methyltransferase